MAVRYYNDDCKYRLPQKRLTAEWLRRVAKEEGYVLGDVSYIFCSANLITPFSDRLGDTYQVDFLKSVCSEKTRPYLSGNNYDRCTVYHCIGNTGDCIRCSGTACHQTNTYLTRYAGKTLRCMSSSLFVANQDMVQCILMIVQSIEYRHDRTSGITEDSSHSLMFQGTHQCFRTCY